MNYQQSRIQKAEHVHQRDMFGSYSFSNRNCGLMPDANHIAIPEMFKAVARCFCFDKFTTKVFFDSDYEWEVFDISYEGGELVINSLYSAA